MITKAEGPARSIAVVGAGISGLTAAYLLSQAHHVTLYEADTRLGGHAHTHDVCDSAGQIHAVDSGFIVHNDRTYPYLRQLFGELGVQTQPTEMSMSIKDEVTGIEYAGGRGLSGLFAQRRRIADLRYLSILAQVKKFQLRARGMLEDSDDSDQTTYGEFLAEGRFSGSFIKLYAIPVMSCVWSMGSEAVLDFPARYLFQFLAHHGLLSVTGSPQWYTMAGGSRTYVDRLSSKLSAVRVGSAVTTVLREDDGVSVQTNSGEWNRHDAIVLATHADQALGILGDPDRLEKEVLGAFAYSRNEAALHTDARVLPKAVGARASWNYLCGTGSAPVVSYWLNRLQGLNSPEQYLVTLNATAQLEPDRIISVIDYQHPIYNLAAINAQARLPELNTPTTVFAGAYHGWGFHEDGCRSGVQAAQALGVQW